MFEAIFVTGPAASGKTHLSKALSLRLQIPIVDIDDTTGEFLIDHKKFAAEISIDDYLKQNRVRRYGDLLARACQIIDGGTSVIVTAPFTEELKNLALWAEIVERFESHGASIRLVWLSVGSETLARRLIERGESRDADKTENLESLRLHLERSHQEPPIVPHVRIETDWDLEKQINLTIR